MDFLKKHYEKVLLGVVLLGLAVAVGFLPFKIASERQATEDKISNLSHPKVDPLPALNLALPEAARQRLGTPTAVNFSEPNKLFNPMPWQRTADGRLIPGTKVGPNVATLTNLTRLWLIISLDRVTLADTGPTYTIGVERQAAATIKDRYKKQYYCKLNNKNEIFTLIEVQGSPDDPTKLVVQLNDTGEKATLTKELPFKRVDGYMVTVNYDPEHKTWKDRRVGAAFVFNFEEYKIVTINQNEVVLTATSNQKKWTIKYGPDYPVL